MPLFFLIAGLILLVTGINGTTARAGELLKRDLTGPNNFFTWFFAIVFAGSLGYVPTLRPVSIAFMVLIFVSIMLSSGSGFFDKLQTAIKKLQGGTSGDNTSLGDAFSIPNIDFNFDLSLPDLSAKVGDTYSI